MLLLFSLLFLAALPHAQFGQQNLDVCFSFPKSILISLPKRGTKQAEVITDAPRGAGLWGYVTEWRARAHLTDPSWNPVHLHSTQTCTRPTSWCCHSAVGGSCSICTTHVIREHACSVGTSHLSCVPDWWLSLLSCDIPLIYTNPLPPLSLCNFCPLQGRECVSAFLSC